MISSDWKLSTLTRRCHSHLNTTNDFEYYSVCDLKVLGILTFHLSFRLPLP